jgi:hypothetical protein
MLLRSAANICIGCKARRHPHKLCLNTKLVALHPYQLPSNLATQIMCSSVGGRAWAVSSIAVRERCVHLVVELLRMRAILPDIDEKSGGDVAGALGAWIEANLLSAPNGGEPFRGVLHVQVRCVCVCVCVCVYVCV